MFSGKFSAERNFSSLFNTRKTTFFFPKKDLILQLNESGKQAKGVQRFPRYPTETHQGFQIFHSDFISHRRREKIFYEHFSQHFETFEISSRLVSPYGAQKRIYYTTWNCAVEGGVVGRRVRMWIEWMNGTNVRTEQNIRSEILTVHHVGIFSLHFYSKSRFLPTFAGSFSCRLSHLKYVSLSSTKSISHTRFRIKVCDVAGFWPSSL